MRRLMLVQSSAGQAAMRGRPHASAFAALLGLVVACVPSVPCAAQTLNLGQGQYAVYENGGTLNLTTSIITGNVEFKASKQETLIASSINGTQTTSVSPVVTTLPAANTTTNLGSINITALNNAMALTGHAGVNVYNLTSMNITSNSLTINGASNETFVFNISGAGGMSLTAAHINLNGIDAKQVVFNVTGGAAAVTSSGLSGTIVDQSHAVSLTTSSMTGAIVSGGPVSLTGSSLTGDSFAAPAAITAPELPTIVPTALSCLVFFGAAGARRVLRMRTDRRARRQS